MKKSILTVMAVLASFSFCAADTKWTGGGGNSAWGNSLNWNNGTPDSADNVEISAIPSALSITGASGTVLSLFIDQDSHSLALSGTGLTLNGLYIQSGGFTANLPLTIPYSSEQGCYITHESSQDAVFNELVTLPTEGESLAVSTTLEDAPGRIYFLGGLAGDGLLSVLKAQVVLGDASTHTGGTEVVDGGSLFVENTTGSGTGSGDVYVGELSLIGGNGSISGNLTCDIGALIGANLITGPGGHTPLQVGGALTLNDTAIPLTSVGGAPTAGTYTLVVADSITGTVVPGVVDLPEGLSAQAPQIVGNTIQVTLTGSAILAWRTIYGWEPDGSGTNQGNNEDFDGDGFTNLQEYAFNTNPTSKSSVPRAGASIFNSGGGNRLRISFTRHTERTDINYIVQVSNSLTGTWTNIAQSLLGGELTDISGGTHAIDQGAGIARTVTVTDNALVSSNTKRFLRVQVVYP